MNLLMKNLSKLLMLIYVTIIWKMILVISHDQGHIDLGSYENLVFIKDHI